MVFIEHAKSSSDLTWSIGSKYKINLCKTFSSYQLEINLRPLGFWNFCAFSSGFCLLLLWIWSKRPKINALIVAARNQDWAVSYQNFVHRTFVSAESSHTFPRLFQVESRVVENRIQNFDGFQLDEIFKLRIWRWNFNLKSTWMCHARIVLS